MLVCVNYFFKDQRNEKCRDCVNNPVPAICPRNDGMTSNHMPVKVADEGFEIGCGLECDNVECEYIKGSVSDVDQKS